WLASAPQAVAQGSYGDNPYTGAGTRERTGYNPYTRTMIPAGYKPYTRRTPAAPAAYNHYTRAGAAVQADYNPYTARYGSRSQKRTLPGGWQRLVPITGKAGSGLDHLDDAMLRILEKYGIPGGVLAIAKDGRLVLARGYGWANLRTGEPVKPEALFG